MADVLVADPVRASWSAESPPAKVEVPCPAPTVIAAANVEVAVVLVAWMLLKIPKEPVWMSAKELPVVVAWVLVELVKVVRPKAFTPLHVLLLARRVDDAPVIAVLQPKVPFV